LRLHQNDAASYGSAHCSLLYRALSYLCPHRRTHRPGVTLSTHRRTPKPRPGPGVKVSCDVGSGFTAHICYITGEAEPGVYASCDVRSGVLGSCTCGTNFWLYTHKAKIIRPLIFYSKIAKISGSLIFFHPKTTKISGPLTFSIKRPLKVADR
jgi:hypothetical protein